MPNFGAGVMATMPSSKRPTALAPIPPGPPPFPAGYEIGWRLARSAWGRGFASEAGAALLAHGFETLGLLEVLAFTARTNLRSQAVMRRIGLQPDPSRDFDHPALAPGHPLRAHVVWVARRAAAGANGRA
jgi:RimJ/RimL family protein N-acetyltransferase